MARQRNYGFERRRKADLQRAKQEAKRQRKADRERTGEAGPEMGEPQDTSAPEGVWEWFSPSRNRTATSPPAGRPASDPPDDWILLTTVEESPAPEP
jgi:hypothetical protein